MPAATGTYIGSDGQTYQQGQTNHAPVSSTGTSAQTSSSGTYIGADGQTYQEGQTSHTPIAKPADTVFSSNAASNFISNTMTPTMQNGMSGIAAQNIKSSLASDPYTSLQGETPEVYNKRIAALKSSASAQGATPNPLDTLKAQAMQHTMNQTDDGHSFVYDTDTGARSQIVTGSTLPPNTSLTPPADPTKRGIAPQESHENENGNKYIQYADGTYGVTDASGKYIGQATSQMFDQAKANDPQEVLRAINTSLSSLKVGSVPLSDTQQAQINGLQTKFSQLITDQTTANANFTGAVTIAQNLYGMGNSLAGIGAIKASIDAGVSKIANLQSQSAAAIAEMQSSFDKENYTMMFDKYKVQQSIAEQIQTHINRLEDVAVKARNDAFLQKLESDKFTYQQKQDMIQDAFKNKEITETQRVHLADESLKRQELTKGTYQYNATTGEVFNTRTGKVMAIGDMGVHDGTVKPGQTGNVILDNNTKTTESGIPYIDGTAVKGKLGQNAQLDAAKLGIPYLDTANADAMANIETARTNLGNIKNMVALGAPSGPIERLWLGPINKAAAAFQSDADKAAFPAWRAAAIQALRAMAGSKGLRINQAEIQTSIDNDIPKITDSIGAVESKMKIVNSMLDSQEKGVFGKDVYNKYVKDENNPMGLTPPGISSSPTASFNNPIGI